jgi:hypothetical protein
LRFSHASENFLKNRLYFLGDHVRKDILLRVSRFTTKGIHYDTYDSYRFRSAATAVSREQLRKLRSHIPTENARHTDWHA